MAYSGNEDGLDTDALGALESPPPLDPQSYQSRTLILHIKLHASISLHPNLELHGNPTPYIRKQKTESHIRTTFHTHRDQLPDITDDLFEHSLDLLLAAMKAHRLSDDTPKKTMRRTLWKAVSERDPLHSCRELLDLCFPDSVGILGAGGSSDGGGDAVAVGRGDARRRLLGGGSHWTDQVPKADTATTTTTSSSTPRNAHEVFKRYGMKPFHPATSAPLSHLQLQQHAPSPTSLQRSDTNETFTSPLDYQDVPGTQDSLLLSASMESLRVCSPTPSWTSAHEDLLEGKEDEREEADLDDGTLSGGTSEEEADPNNEQCLTLLVVVRSAFAKDVFGKVFPQTLSYTSTQQETSLQQHLQAAIEKFGFENAGLDNVGMVELEGTEVLSDIRTEIWGGDHLEIFATTEIFGTTDIVCLDSILKQPLHHRRTLPKRWKVYPTWLDGTTTTNRKDSNLSNARIPPSIQNFFEFIAHPLPPTLWNPHPNHLKPLEPLVSLNTLGSSKIWESVCLYGPNVDKSIHFWKAANEYFGWVPLVSKPLLLEELTHGVVCGIRERVSKVPWKTFSVLVISTSMIDMSTPDILQSCPNLLVFAINPFIKLEDEPRLRSKKMYTIFVGTYLSYTERLQLLHDEILKVSTPATAETQELLERFAFCTPNTTSKDLEPLLTTTYLTPHLLSTLKSTTSILDALHIPPQHLGCVPAEEWYHSSKLTKSLPQLREVFEYLEKCGRFNEGGISGVKHQHVCIQTHAGQVFVKFKFDVEWMQAFHSFVDSLELQLLKGELGKGVESVRRLVRMLPNMKEVQGCKIFEKLLKCLETNDKDSGEALEILKDVRVWSATKIPRGFELSKKFDEAQELPLESVLAGVVGWCIQIFDADYIQVINGEQMRRWRVDVQKREAELDECLSLLSTHPKSACVIDFESLKAYARVHVVQSEQGAEAWVCDLEKRIEKKGARQVVVVRK
ncbi:hypothetical protein HDV05_002594 [Chytridiales sp. JEL 0842]|nr:hypothetical protein HDV05_002594 [Chytridiales sp. JEL 0842]